MGFFSEDEIDTVSVNRTILHVVGNDIEFEPQAELEGDEHADFFLRRIGEAAASAVHQFAAGSPTKALIEAIARGDQSFEEGSQELARRFSQGHRGSSTNGAFFVIELTGDDPDVKFFSMMKYDYRDAVELSHVDGRNVLRQIVQAFVRVVSRMWWKLSSGVLRACGFGPDQAARSRLIGAIG